MNTKASAKPKGKATQQRLTAETARRKKSSRSLRDVVGPEVYQTWVAMLHRLVPDGRTHRLAPVVAAMLQYAVAVVEEKRGADTDTNSVDESLLNSMEAFEPEEMKEILDDVVTRPFVDARVAYGRTSARGEKYSIIEEAYREYIHWFDMPWEG